MLLIVDNYASNYLQIDDLINIIYNYCLPSYKKINSFILADLYNYDIGNIYIYIGYYQNKSIKNENCILFLNTFLYEINLSNICPIIDKDSDDEIYEEIYDIKNLKVFYYNSRNKNIGKELNYSDCLPNSPNYIEIYSSNIENCGLEDYGLANMKVDDILFGKSSYQSCMYHYHVILHSNIIYYYAALLMDNLHGIFYMYLHNI